jgi:hypothetical protein
MSRGNPEKTIIAIDLRDLYDKVWEATHRKELEIRKSMGVSTFIREHIIRPMFEEKK